MQYCLWRFQSQYSHALSGGGGSWLYSHCGRGYYGRGRFHDAASNRRGQSDRKLCGRTFCGLRLLCGSVPFQRTRYGRIRRSYQEHFHRNRIFGGEIPYPQRRHGWKHVGRRSGCFSGIHGRGREICCGLSGWEDPIYQCDEPPVGGL